MSRAYPTKRAGRGSPKPNALLIASTSYYEYREHWDEVVKDLVHTFGCSTKKANSYIERHRSEIVRLSELYVTAEKRMEEFIHTHYGGIIKALIDQLFESYGDEDLPEDWFGIQVEKEDLEEDEYWQYLLIAVEEVPKFRKMYGSIIKAIKHQAERFFAKAVQEEMEAWIARGEVFDSDAGDIDK